MPPTMPPPPFVPAPAGFRLVRSFDDIADAIASAEGAGSEISDPWLSLYVQPGTMVSWTGIKVYALVGHGLNFRLWSEGEGATFDMKHVSKFMRCTGCRVELSNIHILNAFAQEGYRNGGALEMRGALEIPPQA